MLTFVLQGRLLTFSSSSLMKTLDSSVLTNCGPRSGMRFSKNNRSIAGLQGFSGGFPELFTITQAMTPSANNAQLRGNPSKSPYICILFDSPQMIKLNDPCIINSIPPPNKKKSSAQKNSEIREIPVYRWIKLPFLLALLPIICPNAIHDESHQSRFWSQVLRHTGWHV